MTSRLLFCLILLFHFSVSFKIVIFVPTLSNSQALLNYRLGELIASAGHEVTLFRPQYNPEVNAGKVSKAKEYRMSTGIEDEYLELHDEMQGTLFNSTGFTTLGMGFLNRWYECLLRGCEKQIQDKEVMKMLSQQHLAIVHPYDYCPFGLIHAAKIPTYIWMSSTTLLDIMAVSVGAPVPTSYVPGLMSSYSDEMDFVERGKNTMGYLIMNFMIDYMATTPTTALFRRHFGEQFPQIADLSSNSPLIFVNSEELLDLPRPILHKIIYVGGFGHERPEPLTPDFQKLMDESQDGVVLMSFGSVANSSSMPEHWKEAFLASFAKFPTYTFVWKYEKDNFEAAKGVKNLQLSKWVPQRDMFGHPKIRAFITHGGYNSFLEAMFNGVPMIPVPLFGDQYQTAVRGKRHGVAFPLDKTTITEATVTAALEAVLHDHTFKNNAKRIQSMLRKKPVKADDLIVKWVEFLAEHKQLPNFVPAGTRLNFVQYHLLDLTAASLVLVFVGLYVLKKILGLYYWWCCANYKPKKD